jgi:uncharacterized protein YbbK (DUF523 family)
VIMIAASACLLGLNCRWDGTSSLRKKLLLYLPHIIPFCPEQMGGLTTPREPAQIINGNGIDVINGRAKVLDASRKNVTQEFIRGALEVMNLVKQYNITEIILKERSPSCAVHAIYRGNYIVSGMGVTCALFLREGFKVLSDEEIENYHV